MSDQKSLENSSAMRNLSSSKPVRLYLGSKAMRVRANLSLPRPQKPNNTSLDFQDPGQTSVDQDKGPSLTYEKISLRALISQQKQESGVSRPPTQIHDETVHKDSPAKGKNLFFKDDKEKFKWRENNIVNYYRGENGKGYSLDMFPVDFDLTKVKNWVSTEKSATDRKEDAHEESKRPNLRRPQSSVLLKSPSYWETRPEANRTRNKFSPARNPVSTTKPQAGPKSPVKLQLGSWDISNAGLSLKSVRGHEFDSGPVH
jgi:hypothetical protein